MSNRGLRAGLVGTPEMVAERIRAFSRGRRRSAVAAVQPAARGDGAVRGRGDAAGRSRWRCGNYAPWPRALLLSPHSHDGASGDRGLTAFRNAAAPPGAWTCGGESRVRPGRSLAKCEVTRGGRRGCSRAIWRYRTRIIAVARCCATGGRALGDLASRRAGGAVICCTDDVAHDGWVGVGTRFVCPDCSRAALGGALPYGRCVAAYHGRAGSPRRALGEAYRAVVAFKERRAQWTSLAVPLARALAASVLEVMRVDAFAPMVGPSGRFWFLSLPSKTVARMSTCSHLSPRSSSRT